MLEDFSYIEIGMKNIKVETSKVGFFSNRLQLYLFVHFLKLGLFDENYFFNYLHILPFKNNFLCQLRGGRGRTEVLVHIKVLYRCLKLPILIPLFTLSLFITTSIILLRFFKSHLHPRIIYLYV